ncbi:phage major capsid protein [Kitasatospora sp. NPDC048296]|uniref:phage major capsid protein n=1 Tax=Kitasatospora sp. NPDC048296 TaxID=3364048 RepID=UPI00371CEC5E
MSFIDLAKRSLEARQRLFKEYKSVDADTSLSASEKRAKLEALKAVIDEKGEEVKDYTAKAEMEAENRRLGNPLAALFKDGNTGPYEAEERGWATGKGFMLPSEAEYRSISTLPASAGAAVPPGVFQDFVVSMRQKATFLKGKINLLPMNEGFMHVPVISGDGSSSVVPEGAQIPVSDLSFGDAGFASYKVAQLAAITSEVLEDAAVDVRKAVSEAMMRNVAATVDSLFYNGTGTNQPMGILKVPGLTSTALTAAVTLDNLADEMAQIEAYGGKVTEIHTDPATYNVIRKLKANTAGLYFSSPFAGTDGPQQVWGADLIPAPHLPAGTIIIMDGNQVYTGLRRQIELQYSFEFFFDTDRLGARVTSRWAGVGVADTRAVRILTKAVNGT